MRGTGSADLRIDSSERLNQLPKEARSLLDSGGLFSSQAWWDVVLAHALPAGARPVFVVGRAGARVVLVAPMLRQGRLLGALTSPYTCVFTPALASGLDDATGVAAMAALAGWCRSTGIVRLDALPVDWQGLPWLEQGAQRAGLLAYRFDHFGNWYEDVGGLDWPGYLARRPGALRETIRRRLRRAEALPGARFHLLSAPSDMAFATEAYETVYARSWKEPEPYPHFNTAFMRRMAEEGALRFGLWSLDGVPAAVQIWVVSDGRATVLKLAHDEAFKAHSPGTVLTALMLRHLLDIEHVTEIDFGRGDDEYKRGWAGERRQRIGVLLANPWRPRGTMEVIRRAVRQIRDSMRAGR
ncbi:MAG: GNAT family N-acetyltransferase [Acetobacteraceae bacterium]